MLEHTHKDVHTHTHTHKDVKGGEEGRAERGRSLRFVITHAANIVDNTIVLQYTHTHTHTHTRQL